MKRRAAALLCALVLVCRWACGRHGRRKRYASLPSTARCLPLSDATMPFWSGGYLYIPASIFTGTVRKELGINYIRTSKNLRSSPAAEGSAVDLERERSVTERGQVTIRWPLSAEMRFLWRCRW